MVNFANVILVKLVPTEPMFIAITTFDVKHRKSSRFLVLKSDLKRLTEPGYDGRVIVDTDIGSYIRIARINSTVHFRLTWLRHNSNNEVSGYVHDFEIPLEKVRAVINLQAVHHVEYPDKERDKARVVLTDSCHQYLNRLRQDKLTRHAIRCFFRDNLNYGRDERLVIYPDSWVNGFYFNSSSNLEGGIVRHEETVTGKDGRKHKKVYFSVHT